jgi:phosphate starvation-inducible PhoH-like protein
MPKKQTERSDRRNAKRSGAHPEQYYSEALPPAAPKRAAPFEPKNDKQRKYAAAMRVSGNVVFGMGPAGTGKTFVAACMAADALMEKKVERIILTRPAIEAGGEELGFLPGEKEQKFDPYFDPFRDALEERLGKSFVELLIKDGRIKCEPFAYMRGKTFKNAFVILDEAQNANVKKMKLFLTRIGENSTVVVNGDETQVDIAEPSGFVDAANRLLHISRIKVVMFNKTEVVRSGLVQEVVEAYEAPAPDRINPMLQR